MTRENPKKYGNARLVRNVFEKTIENLAVRVIQKGVKSDRDLIDIVFSDVPSFEEMMSKKSNTSAGNGNIINF